MSSHVGGAEFDALAVGGGVGWCEFDACATGTVDIGWCEFDACATGTVHVGWCEFDATSTGTVCVGWCELDCLSPNESPVPPYRPGGGVTRYSDNSRRKYDIPVDEDLVYELEDEQIVMKILMEIAEYVLV